MPNRHHDDTRLWAGKRMTDTAIEVQRKTERARRRALHRLAERHPEEFYELFDFERKGEGLPPVNRRGLGNVVA
jgi:hypothetical protein